MDSKIRIAAIKSGSFADGPNGPRTVIWLQGCSIRCPHCQNKNLWDPEGPAVKHSPSVAANFILDIADRQPLTITGGEPFDQADVLAWTLRRIRELDPDRHIILYSGYEWAEIEACLHQAHSVTRDILDRIDILVDGPYVKHEDDPYIQWRGSRNQRAIDVRATMARDRSTWADPVVLDWDTPTIEIDDDTSYATGGTFGNLGIDYHIILRCGEVGSDG